MYCIIFLFGGEVEINSKCGASYTFESTSDGIGVEVGSAHWSTSTYQL
jgi:hypothetical protein